MEGDRDVFRQNTIVVNEAYRPLLHHLADQEYDCLVRYLRRWSIVVDDIQGIIRHPNDICIGGVVYKQIQVNHLFLY